MEDCTCGGVPIQLNEIVVCSICGITISEAEENNPFIELKSSELTIHNERSLEIRNIASKMFISYIRYHIKRGKCRTGLAGACIYLASIHCNYPLTVMEITNMISGRSKYITNELKTLQVHLETVTSGYDIRITDSKYINRIILDIGKVFEIESELYRERLESIIDRMNNDDILINNNATTRISGVFYLLILPKLDRVKYCKICHISENTFRKFQALLLQHDIKF